MKWYLKVGKLSVAPNSLYREMEHWRKFKNSWQQCYLQNMCVWKMAIYWRKKLVSRAALLPKWKLRRRYIFTLCQLFKGAPQTCRPASACCLPAATTTTHTCETQTFCNACSIQNASSILIYIKYIPSIYMLSHAMQCVYIFVFCDVKKIISIVFYSSLRANSPALNGRTTY